MTQFNKGDLVRVRDGAKSLFGTTVYAGDLAIVHLPEGWQKGYVFVTGIDPNNPENGDKAYKVEDVTLVQSKFFTEWEAREFNYGAAPEALVQRFRDAQKKFDTDFPSGETTEKVIFARDVRDGDVVIVGDAELTVELAIKDLARLNHRLIGFAGLQNASYRDDAQFKVRRTTKVTHNTITAKSIDAGTITVKSVVPPADEVKPIGTVVHFHTHNSYYKKVGVDRWTVSDRYGNDFGGDYRESDVGGRIRRGEAHTIIR